MQKYQWCKGKPTIKFLNHEDVWLCDDKDLMLRL